jgi:hypothetical protein
MGIEDINISEELQTDAPSIKYSGNEGPKSPQQEQQMMQMEQGKQMAAQIWEQMEPGQKEQFQSFEAFFESGIWKQIIQQMQQDQSGGMNMSENVNMQEQMPGGGIADVDMREQVQTAANGGLMGLYNRGM